MTTFYLYKVCCGERVSVPVEVNGFIKAEETAKKMLDEMCKYYPGGDHYVSCVENMHQLNTDHFVMRKDADGVSCWGVLVMGTYCPVCIRFPFDYEEDGLYEWASEVDRHISDLSDEELQELRSEICVGSCYLGDYGNSFSIDRQEVSNACDSYEKHLAEEGLEDTPENFAKYMREEY